MDNKKTGTLMYDTYFKRYSAGYPTLFQQSPKTRLKQIITIPVLAEEALDKCLESLDHNKQGWAETEVIILINESEKASIAIKEKNRRIFTEATQLKKTFNHPDSFLVAHVTLPEKHAGVGLARKVVMDEALRRFQFHGTDGIIVGLDADCLVSQNYLSGTLEHFSEYNTEGCSIHYEHLLDNHKEEIVSYELMLRYYVLGLRWAGYDHAYQTLGSSMAVKASVYAATGGMNRRKAAEDFYFLEKIVQRGRFTNCTNATVYPASRISDRVPFGTGKAIMDRLNKPDPGLYHPDIFVMLRKYLISVKNNYPDYPETENEIALFFDTPEARIQHRKAVNHTKDLKSFIPYFFRWLNGLKVLQWTHYIQQKKKNIPTLQALEWYYQQEGIQAPVKERPLSDLLLLREKSKLNI